LVRCALLGIDRTDWPEGLFTVNSNPLNDGTRSARTEVGWLRQDSSPPSPRLRRATPATLSWLKLRRRDHRPKSLKAFGSIKPAATRSFSDQCFVPKHIPIPGEGHKKGAQFAALMCIAFKATW